MTTGASRWPRDTLDKLLSDHERRLTQVERRPQGPVVPNDTVVAVATVAEIDDPTEPFYVLADGLVHFGATTMTYAAWLAAH